MKLLTLDQAKAHLRITHNSEDVEIDAMIDAASQAIVGYLGDFSDTFLDTSGEPAVLTDTGGTVITGYVVPPMVQQACKILVGEWSKNREGLQDGAVDAQFGFGYLPRPVVALLYPLRLPVMA